MEITVDHTLSLAEDAKRRDFTFNALYKGVGPGLPGVGGRGRRDRPHGQRPARSTAPHRPSRTDSFVDDPLRILRALRFVSTLNADLDRRHAGADVRALRR
jgi:tRNA nucleotidyltransferase/poly(A) polymerase